MKRSFNLGDRRLSSTLGLLVEALIQAGVVSFASIGRAMSGSAKPASKIRRAFEFCHNPRVNQEAIQESLVRILCGQVQPTVVGGLKVIVVAMDWHSYDADGVSSLRVSLMTGTRALPLIWYEVSTKNLKGQMSRIEKAALQRLAEWRPEGVKWLILADAGFRSAEVVDAMSATGYFIVRSGSHMRVRSRKNRWTRVGELPVRNRQLVDFGWVQWNQSKPRDVRLVASRIYDVKPPRPGRRKSNHKTRYRYSKPGLCAVITNLPDVAFSSRAIIRLYGRRFEIEHSFRDLKNASFGLDMEHVHLRDESTYARLMMIVAIAEAILWLAGSEAESVGLHRDLSPSRPRNGRRVISLVNVGRHCLSKISGTIEELLAKHLPAALNRVPEVIGRTWKDVRDTLMLRGKSSIPLSCSVPTSHCGIPSNAEWTLIPVLQPALRLASLRSINA